MGKSYCFVLEDDPSIIVCAFTVSNDSIRVYDLPRSRRDYMKHLTHKHMRRYREYWSDGWRLTKTTHIKE